MPLPSGARIGPYEIIGQLGAGGMGEVYRARDSRLDRDVAIKVLRDDLTGDRDRLQRFIQEAKAASSLNHPHIVTVHDIGTEGDVVYMVMELVTGRALADVTPADGFSVPDVLRIGSQIADACAAAHARQIVHRDLKPANVMLQADGRVKVLDFGLAKFIEKADEARSVTQTAAGTILGTVAYMSPEQAEGKQLDARTDIFSLGALLYEISTGKRAFPGESQASVFAAVLKEDPRSPEEVRADLPAELGRVIMRCLRKDPARRVQSMADLRAALDELRDELTSGKLKSGAAAAASDLGSRRASARRVPTIAVAAGIALVAVAGYFGWRSMGAVPAPPSAPLATLPLTAFSGSEYAGGFSPDGSQVVFNWNGEAQDNEDIYIKAVGPGAPVRLTTDPAPDQFPAWSPDGKQIAFVRGLSSSVFALILVPSQGGPERKVLEVYPRVAILPYINLAWTRDSRFVLLASGRVPGEPSNIQCVSIDTGEVKTVAAVPPVQDGYFSLDISPDGRRLATARDNGGFDRIEVFDVSAEAELSNPKIFETVTNAVDVRWTADSRDLLFRRSANNPGPLYRFSPDAGGAGIVTPLLWVGPGASKPVISPTTHRLLFTRNVRDTNIWRVVLGTGARPVMDKIAVSSFREVAPQYSPDGRRMAFHSNRSGSVQIWVADADGSKAVQLTNLDEFATTGTPRWSPDSKQIVFDTNASTAGGYHLFVINADGGEPRALTTGSSRSFTGWWSPDGRWIYFCSDRSGRLETWRMPPAGGTAEQVTRSRSEAPSLSPDGQWLYFTKKEGVDGLWRMPVAGGAETRVVDSLFRYNYFPTVKGVYYVTRPDDRGLGALVRYLDFASKRVQDITAIDARVDLGLTVSPDGKYLLFTKMDYVGADLMLVENFR